MFGRISIFTISGSLLTTVAVGCVDISGGSEPHETRVAQSATALMTQADCPSGSHVIVGTEGDDNIVGTDGADCIVGLGGNDTINGGNGNDLIFGGPGNDVIHGGNGNDSIYGEDGNDVIDGSNGNDAIFAGAGNDVVSGGNGNDSILGEDGNDTITGNNGDDALFGGLGDDTLVAGNGTDTLNGENGLDTCSQAGADCEQIQTPPSCQADSACSAGQLCVAPVDMCVRCTADPDPFVDVDGWVGGPYSGAFGNFDDDSDGVYNEIGQSFVASSSGTLAGVSFNCTHSRYDAKTLVRVFVHEFDPDTGTTGVQVGSGDFDVSDISIDLLEPSDRFFALCGRRLEAGRTYLVSTQVREASFLIAFTLQANVSYPFGGMWVRNPGDSVWQSYGDDDSDFRIWLNSN